MTPRTIGDLGPDIAARYPYVSRFVTVNGWRMHYVDEGPPDAIPVLLLHGNPTWGYLWRDSIVPLLEAGFRVVVPDQIGLGLSERPLAASAHSLDNHAANLVALLDALDLRRVVFVCHDWGGPTGLTALLARRERAAAVAVLSSWAWVEPSPGYVDRLVPWRTLHAPLVGPQLIGRHAAMPARAVYLSVVDRERFERTGRAAYEAVAGEAGQRRAMWQWPRWIPLGLPGDPGAQRFQRLEGELAGLRLPATLIWGRDDDVFGLEEVAPRWQRLWPHAEGVHVVTGRHFLQEDSGEEIGRLLAEFASRTVSVG